MEKSEWVTGKLGEAAIPGTSTPHRIVPADFVDLQKNCRLICWRIVVESWSGSFLLGHLCEQVV